MRVLILLLCVLSAGCGKSELDQILADNRKQIRELQSEIEDIKELRCVYINHGIVTPIYAGPKLIGHLVNCGLEFHVVLRP